MQIHKSKVEKRTTTGIVRDPSSSLASATGTYERISDGAALAQVGVVNTTWAKVRLSRLQRPNSEHCKNDKTMRPTNARQNKQANDLPPPLHVPNMFAATSHGSWLRELNDWTKSTSGQVTARGRTVEMTMHTHAHVDSQFGELIWASAVPEKKTKNASGVARSDICGCLAALRVCVWGAKQGTAVNSNRLMD